MNYTSLKTNIQDICETSFTDDQLALFVQQAEQRIYNTVHIPAMRNVDSSSLTAGDELYTTPDGYLYTYSLAIVDSDTHTFLLNKDVNFLREAYPVTTTAKRGLPKFYAYHSTSGNKIKFMFSHRLDPAIILLIYSVILRLMTMGITAFGLKMVLSWK